MLKPNQPHINIRNAAQGLETRRAQASEALLLCRRLCNALLQAGHVPGFYLRPDGLWNDSGALRAAGMRGALTFVAWGFFRSSSSPCIFIHGAAGLTMVLREESFAAAFASIIVHAFR